MRVVVRSSLFCLLIVLAACGSTGTPIPTLTPIPNNALAPDDIPDYGLVAGGYHVTVIGAVAGTTSTTNPIPIEYGAGVNGLRHPGTNETGNVGVSLVANLANGGEGVLLLEFAGTLGTGTHAIGANTDLNPAPVGAIFRMNGRAPFDKRVSGTLTLDFINRRSINGEFDVTLLDSSGQAVTVRGAFHRVPYTPREEYSIQLNGVYTALDFEPQFSKGITGDARFITLGFITRRAFAEAETGTVTITARPHQTLQAGAYDVLAAVSPVAVQVRLGDAAVTVQSGTVLFVRTSDIRNGIVQPIWQGAFTLTLNTEAGATTLTGLFNHFDL